MLTPDSVDLYLCCSLSRESTPNIAHDAAQQQEALLEKGSDTNRLCETSSFIWPRQRAHEPSFVKSSQIIV